MIKNLVYFCPTFSHFFVMADGYQFSSKPADFRMLSVRSRQKIVYCFLGCSKGSNQVGEHTGIW